MAEETGKKKERASGHGSVALYAVEARVRDGLNSDPVPLTPELILDCKWREVHFDESPVGIWNRHGEYACLIGAGSLMDFEAATALAAWVRASKSLRVRWSVETRLVSYELDYTYKILRNGASAATDNHHFSRKELFSDE